MMYRVESLNSTNNYSEHLLDINNINKYNNPVLTVIGYTSTLKEVYRDGKYVQPEDSHLNKFKDVYTYYAHGNNVMTLERKVNEGIIKVEKNLLERLIRFERVRQYYVSKSQKQRTH